MAVLLKSIKTNSDYPIKVEKHPRDYTGYDFITLIKYNEEINLTIVDNVYKKHVDAYCLDLCGPAEVDEKLIIKVANHWYNSNSENYPISIEFSRRGLAPVASKIMKSYPVDFITRIIGPIVPQFYMGNPKKVRKRKRKIPKDYEVIITSEHFKSILTRV